MASTPQIFVGNLAADTTESVILEQLGQYGAVQATVITRPPVTYAFVTFATAEQVESILANPPNIFLNRRKWRFQRIRNPPRPVVHPSPRPVVHPSPPVGPSGLSSICVDDVPTSIGIAKFTDRLGGDNIKGFKTIPRGPTTQRVIITLPSPRHANAVVLLFPKLVLDGKSYPVSLGQPRHHPSAVLIPNLPGGTILTDLAKVIPGAVLAKSKIIQSYPNYTHAMIGFPSVRERGSFLSQTPQLPIGSALYPIVPLTNTLRRPDERPYGWFAVCSRVPNAVTPSAIMAEYGAEGVVAVVVAPNVDMKTNRVYLLFRGKLARDGFVSKHPTVTYESVTLPITPVAKLSLNNNTQFEEQRKKYEQSLLSNPHKDDPLAPPPSLPPSPSTTPSPPPFEDEAEDNGDQSESQDMQDDQITTSNSLCVQHVPPTVSTEFLNSMIAAYNPQSVSLKEEAGGTKTAVIVFSDAADKAALLEDYPTIDLDGTLCPVVDGEAHL